MKTKIPLLHRRLLLAIAGTLLAAVSSGASVNGYVIANADVSAADIREIFLGSKQFAGPVRLVPVDNSAARDGFLEHELNMSSHKYSSIWVSRAFRDGTVPPQVLRSDADVVRFVKQTPGAVGYVGVTPPADIRVVTSY